MKQFNGMWCSGITSAQHARGPEFNPQRARRLRFNASSMKITQNQMKFNEHLN